MKILHLNYYQTQGGAAIAMQRIHNSLMSQGIDTNILVSSKDSNNPRVIGPESTFEEIINLLKVSFQRKINRLSVYKSNFSQSFNLFPSNILKKIDKINPDIIHLHWIGNEMISIKQLSKIKKPIVWTLHDMWPYCGSEHYSFSDEYINGFKKNSFLFDFNFYTWKLKKKFINSKICFVPTSSWQQNKIKQSYLYKNNFSKLIPLPLDTNFWKPINKKLSRDILNIKEENVILFGGDNLIERKWKGFEIIKKILTDNQNITLKQNTFFLLFGEDKNILQEIKKLGIKYKYFNHIAPNSYDLKLLYSASDLLLMPSLIESFGQLALEAASCGVPTVCFENTGVTEIVQHLKTGYVAKNNSEADFKNGIEWCLKNKNSIEISNNCTDLVKKKFSYNVVAYKYIELYKTLFKN